MKKGWFKKKSDKKGFRPSEKGRIRKIDSDEEILKAFTASEPEEVLPEVTPPPSPEDLSVETPLPKPEKKRPRRVTKSGIPILEDTDDFEALVAEKKKSSEVVREETVSIKKTQGVRKTKHGIPIIEKGADLFKTFETPDEEDFGQILETSLGEKSQDVLLKEKKDNPGPVRSLSLKKRLERFPKPQGEIDLHGFTALRADMKAEAYIKNAFYNGTYTVRIIVGKGLHSEDGPVLPDVIEKRVNQLRDEKIVLAYEWDKKKKHKSGSLTVYLNNYDTRNG